MEDFNAMVGVRECEESCIGQHSIGRRNQRGQMLVNFLDMQGLFCMNTFFKKKPHRKWTWQSPNGMTKNEIDFKKKRFGISDLGISDKKRIFWDISVVNRFNTGSGHRLVRSTLNIDVKVVRSRMMRSLIHPTLLQTMHSSEAFQLELSNRFALLETT
ncbi:craniofacial development protein 2-like [Hyposmocoma kahamanoa]|uniref:craniofacial development protein 2-like n=1 Tax=Hyposmocoma kahamanoa TaxID=1477025 RepID=UPI000E6D98D3|nr:craniofacial development protein 2-like [Hyposmocoma kahamanoa]